MTNPRGTAPARTSVTVSGPFGTKYRYRGKWRYVVVVAWQHAHEHAYRVKASDDYERAARAMRDNQAYWSRQTGIGWVIYDSKRRRVVTESLREA